MAVRLTRLILSSMIAGALLLGSAGHSARAGSPYRTALTRWSASADGFRAWSLDGAQITADGRLALDAGHASLGLDAFAPQGYAERNFYAGGAYLVGEATSPVVAAEIPLQQAIASWNADTPPGTWIEMRIRAHVGGHWTQWYNLGVWAAGSATVERHSVENQKDDDGDVAVDTLTLRDDRPGADQFQVRVRLFSLPGGEAPSVRAVGVATSTKPVAPDAPAPGDPAAWGRVLDVPTCSQMVYPDGGTVWCSPTSTSMVLSYWLREDGPCEPGVRAAKDGVYDWVYDGHGNWPFNTAYAATRGMEAYVARFTSLAEAERWIAAGVPVVINYGWQRGELTGAPLAWSNGHLAVLVGFDAQGNPVVNDPAAPSDAAVQRVYPRAQLETLWLRQSGGTVYLIYPEGTKVP